MRLIHTALVAIGFAMLPFAGVSARDQSSTQSYDPPPPAYSLKAGSRWAAEINLALSQVSQRAQVAVPKGKELKEFLARICAGPTSYSEMSPTESGLVRILLSPCVRVSRNVEIPITLGDTLEGLAVRNGLPPTAASEVKVMSGDGRPVKSVTPGGLKVGDIAILPEVPIWTNVVADPKLAPDRAAMVKALANAVKCGKEDPEACLQRRDITLLDKGTVPKPKADASKLEVGSVRAIAAQPQAEAAAARSAAAPPPPPPPAPAPRPAPALVVLEAAPPEPPAAATIPVAKEQWPYDVRLLAEILRRDRDKIGRATIGIADGGLANTAGLPLPPDLFDPADEWINAQANGLTEPDQEDTDDNKYVDDLFGAGIARQGEFLGTGDVGLCRTNPAAFDTWGEALDVASHGAVVSSIAAALRLRTAAPDVTSLLPKLIFFRMLGEACDPRASFNVGAGDVVPAFYYLSKRSRIVNLSYKIDGPDGRLVRNELLRIVPNRDALLFLAAGNQNLNLDLNGGICPACLGNSNADRGDKAAKRTIVVGAATSDLRRHAESNYGRDTVKLFAPGDATGGVGLTQLPATAIATSYASPYAALGAALIASFGINSSTSTWSDIRDRLEAATWPLHDAASGAEMTGLGVVDLVKAAAVRHHSVEVKEPEEPGGRTVRRTYVGELLTPLAGQVCSGRQLTEARVHAIRLGERRADGSREVRVYHRGAFDEVDDRRIVEVVSTPCRPDGEIKMRTVFGEEKTFALANVTQILLRWQLGR